MRKYGVKLKCFRQWWFFRWCQSQVNDSLMKSKREVGLTEWFRSSSSFILPPDRVCDVYDWFEMDDVFCQVFFFRLINNPPQKWSNWSTLRFIWPIESCWFAKRGFGTTHHASNCRHCHHSCSFGHQKTKFCLYFVFKIFALDLYLIVWTSFIVPNRTSVHKRWKLGSRVTHQVNTSDNDMRDSIIISCIRRVR